MKLILACLSVCLLCDAQQVPISPALFSGVGLNDASSGGVFSGPAANYLFTIIVDGTGAPNTFKWKVNNGSYATAIPMTGSAQALQYGVTIKFSSFGGHTLNDQWVIAVTAHSASNALNYIAPGVGAVFRSNEARLRDTLHLSDFGAKCDGVTDDTAAIAAAFTARNGVGLYVPAGVCIINNSMAALTISGYSGRLWGDKGATFSCNTLAKGCMVFSAPSNFELDNVTFSYSPATTTRNGAQLLTIVLGEHIWISNVKVHNGNSAGLLVQQTDDIHVAGLSAFDLLANGLFVTNTTRMTVSGTICNNVQDYCEEYSGYDPFAGVPSGVCQYITSTGMVAYNSYAGGLINGCPDASFSNFIVSNTYQGAMLIIQDSSTTTTKWPYRSSISNGIISNTGVLAGGNQNADGIYAYLDNAPPAPVDIKISNIQIYNAEQDGVRIGQDTMGDPSLFTASLSNVLADGADGSTITNGGVGFRFAAAGTVTFSALESRNAYAYGLDVSGGGATGIVTNVSGTGLLIYDAENPLRPADPRAAIFQSPGSLSITGVSIIDDRSPALGYQLQDSAVGPVSVTDITYNIPHGSFSISPGSSASKYLLAGQSYRLGAGVSSGTELYSNYFLGTGNPNGATSGNPGDLFAKDVGTGPSSLWIKTSGIGTMMDWGMLLTNIAPLIINGDQTGPASPSTCQVQVEGATNPAQTLDLCYDTTDNFGWIQAQVVGSGPEPLKLNPLGGLVSVSGDDTGTDCQLDVQGVSTPAYRLHLCYDTAGNFGWIQATQTGVANQLLKLNPNGGGVYIYNWLGVNISGPSDTLTNLDSGDVRFANVGISGAANHSGSWPLWNHGKSEFNDTIWISNLTSNRPLQLDASNFVISSKIDIGDSNQIACASTCSTVGFLLWNGTQAVVSTIFANQVMFTAGPGTNVEAWADTGVVSAGYCASYAYGLCTTAGTAPSGVTGSTCSAWTNGLCTSP